MEEYNNREPYSSSSLAHVKEEITTSQEPSFLKHVNFNIFARFTSSSDMPSVPTSFELIKNVPLPPKLDRRWLSICKMEEDFSVRKRLADNKSMTKKLKGKAYISTPTPATHKEVILPPFDPTQPRCVALLEYERLEPWQNPEITPYIVTQALSPLPPPVIMERDPYFCKIHPKNIPQSSPQTHADEHPQMITTESEPIIISTLQTSEAIPNSTSTSTSAPTREEYEALRHKVNFLEELTFQFIKRVKQLERRPQ